MSLTVAAAVAAIKGALFAVGAKVGAIKLTIFITHHLWVIPYVPKVIKLIKALNNYEIGKAARILADIAGGNVLGVDFFNMLSDCLDDDLKQALWEAKKEYEQLNN